MRDIPTFRSKSEAFDYMFATLCEQGEDMMEAAKKAEQFAEIVAKNKSLPDVPKNMLGKCMDMLKQVAEIKKEHPEAWEVVSGLAGGIFGAVVGTSKVEDEEPMAAPINFDEIEDVTKDNDSSGL